MKAIKKPPRKRVDQKKKIEKRGPPKNPKKQCQALRREDGERCNAAVLRGKKYCAAHDPDFNLSKRGVLSKAVKNQSLWLMQKAKAKFLDQMKTWEGHGVMVRALCADILQSEIINPADKALLLKEAIKLNQKYLESTKGKQAEEIKVVIKQIENEAAYLVPQQERPEPKDFKK